LTLRCQLVIAFKIIPSIEEKLVRPLRSATLHKSIWEAFRRNRNKTF
jgi:hypothetical protein